MAGKTKSIKGFGAKYGRKIRGQLGKFLEIKNKEKKCPYCNAMKVKRIAAGIWECKKCNKKFTGRAYDLAKVKIKEEVKGGEEE